MSNGHLLHRQLLEQAQHLAIRERRRPRQGSLRRAVSTAYRSRDPELGRRVGQMADAVRGVLHELLWIGLEDYDGLVDNPNLEPWECG